MFKMSNTNQTVQQKFTDQEMHITNHERSDFECHKCYKYCDHAC